MTVQICPKCRCIYGFVNVFIGWGDLRSPTGVHRTPLRLWRFESIHSFASGGIYIKKCISPVRICLQTRNARNASTKLWKTLSHAVRRTRFSAEKPRRLKSPTRAFPRAAFRVLPSISQNKRPPCGGLLFCEETHKRCVSVGKNAKKVRDFSPPSVRQIGIYSFLKLSILSGFSDDAHSFNVLIESFRF